VARARSRPVRPRSRRSRLWIALRLVLVAWLACLLRVAACGAAFRVEHDAWDANPAHRLAKLFGWTPGGGLAIEGAWWTNRPFENVYGWRARVLDPAAIDALVSARQLGLDSTAAPLTQWGGWNGQPPGWWTPLAPDSLGTIFSRTDDQDEGFWWLWYDSIHCEVFLLVHG